MNQYKWAAVNFTAEQWAHWEQRYLTNMADARRSVAISTRYSRVADPVTVKHCELRQRGY